MPNSSVGDFVGTTRFSILRRVGAGGMGVVYEALDRERNQRVALKTLKQIDPTTVYRFKQEFRSLAELVHPNLIPLYELIYDGQWFFVMELVENAVDFQTFLCAESVLEKTAKIDTENAPTLDVNGQPPADLETAAFIPDASIEPLSSLTTDFAESRNLPETIVTGPAKRDTGNDVHEATGDFSQAATGEYIEADRKTEEAPEVAPKKSSAKRAVRPVRDLGRLREAFRQLCAGVRALHRSSQLHRDLKPGNVLVSPNGRVLLLDFGLVAKLSAMSSPGAEGASHSEGEESSGSYHATDHRISGTVGFMAPEQAAAGKLTEAADWYAVGVMLFMALTGELPFSGSMKRVLSDKQTKDAPAPADLVDGVPAELNDLCVRLLRRDPAGRPSGREVYAFFAGNEAPDLAEEDDARPALAPFIGRERQLAKLGAAFEEMRQGHTVVCRVLGRSGVGKSCLIQHFLDDLASRHEAIVLSGRCYEQESVPFKGVDSLMDALSQFLRIQSPVGPYLPARVAALARIFPALERIDAVRSMGSQPLATNDLLELRRDAFNALREMLGRIGAGHPLVIYLDDLQWGDLDSASLLAELLRGADSPRMLLLASYRSEYAQSSSCLAALSGCEAQPEPRTRWHEVAVEAFTADETRSLARKLLKADLPNAEAGVEWITQQSGGSAYFAYELARHLNAGLDSASLGGSSLDEVLWGRVRRLPADAQQLLQMVAVAGQPVPLGQILDAAGLSTLSPRTLAALRHGHIIRTSGPGLQAEIEAFHDRIRESVVKHLAPEVVRSHHGCLASALESGGTADPETIAGHFEGAEQLQKAGHYFGKAAEQAARKLAFDRAETFHKKAVALARNDPDKADAYEKLIHFNTDMARFADAYAVGREATRLFGVHLPTGFIPPLFVIDFLKVKLRLRGRATADLVDLPTMTDERIASAVRLIAAAAKAAYQIRPELCVAVSTKIVNLCLKHGNTPDCAIGYMVFGAIFTGGVLGNHSVGYDFGRLALAVVDKYRNDRQRPEVTFVVGYFGTSWMRPAVEAEALWRVACETGQATGDLFHTGCAAAATTQSLLMRGVPFDEVWRESERHLEFLRPRNLREPIGAIESVRQTIRNLRGQTRGPQSFSDDAFDEDAYVKTLDSFGSRHFAHFYFVNKMLTAFLRGDLDLAHQMAGRSATYLKDSPGMLHAAEHHFLNGLIETALADRTRGFRRWRHVRAVRAAHKRFNKWRKNCPANFAHKERLLAAESARLTGDAQQAQDAYDAAIAAAAQHGYRQVEALANECASRFHERAGDPVRAAEYRRQAIACYEQWGATACAGALAKD